MARLRSLSSQKLSFTKMLVAQTFKLRHLQRILCVGIPLSALILLVTVMMNPGMIVPVSFVSMSSNTKSGHDRDASESPGGSNKNRYAHRSRVAIDACFKSSLGVVQKVLTDKAGRLANCIVPKVGCTYWINIMRYLSNSTGGRVYTSPFDIPRWITHYGGGLAYGHLSTKVLVQPRLASALRFMFVRDPYTRLWSAWIDKFLLPDFWFTSGKLVNKALGHTGNQSTCAKHVTFVDFLRFVTGLGSFKNPQKMNDHWRPYKHLCDPCLFHPHVIGKIETFGQDSRFILESVNLTWVINRPRAKKKNLTQEKGYADHSLEEIRMLTDYNIDLLSTHRRFLQNCTSQEEVYHRLWTAFQYNGHLPASKSFPRLRDRPLRKKDFLRVAEETYLAWEGRTKAAQSKQKQDALAEGYKLVPSDIMEKIRKLYANDFESYEYDKKPTYLYEHR